ncbi:MAG: 16S rRNA (cytosine(1402)-N(4))-methyltransferase RsmH [Vicinamibacterales bacterium]
MTPLHEPVMVAEAVEVLAPARGGLYLDCTVGLGGHARAILEAGASRLIGLDRDPEALAGAMAALAPYTDRVELVHADYRDTESILAVRGIAAVDGALADLGVSSMQLDAGGRGFSFRRDEPLDMRMDRSQGQTAADLLRDVREEDLADVIFQFGEERYSRRIARAIVSARRAAPIVRTGQLAAIVRRSIRSRGHQRIDPATRTFQALRIWVNRELEDLDLFLTGAARLLAVGARLVVISFHSLEDRIVKQTFRALAGGGAALRLLTKRPVAPSEGEVARNPRARSAKLRAIERFA